MVQTEIRGGQFSIWANAPDKEALIDLTASVLDEMADEFTVFDTDFTDDGTDGQFKLEISFTVNTDGIFVGNVAARNLESEMSEFEGKQAVYYSRMDREEYEELSRKDY